jgi:hypothetical protein
MLTMRALSRQRGNMTLAWTWNRNVLTERPSLLPVLRLYNKGVAPNTSITAGPRSVTTKRRATFRFVSSIPGSTFQCKLDQRSWRRCGSPKLYTGLSRGFHTFRVRARVFGRVDATPAHRSWTITYSESRRRSAALRARLDDSLVPGRSGPGPADPPEEPDEGERAPQVRDG